MTISSTNLLLWGTVIWIPGLLYILLKNETKFKKNIVIGVTLPQNARTDADVQIILTKFKKQLLFVCIGLVLLAIPCIWIPGTGLSITIWLIWLDAVIIVPYVPYIQSHQKLKQLKEIRGWIHHQNNSSIALLTSSVTSENWLSPALFLLPAIIALLPSISDPDMALFYWIDTITILFFGLAYRYLYRNKSETIDDDTLLSETLTRIRKYNWGKTWLFCAWFTALLSLCTWLAQSNYTQFIASIFLLSGILIISVIHIEMKLRKLQEV